jgi:hypothetical protein
MSISYLPHVSPKNNNTQQVRRRVNNIVSQVSDQVGALATHTGDFGRLDVEVQGKASATAPIFDGPVSQPAMPVLTGASIVTTAQAGGASALPATPAGYTHITINGQSFKIPIYLP